MKRTSLKRKLALWLANGLRKLTDSAYEFIGDRVSPKTLDKIDSYKPLPFCSLYIKLGQPIPDHFIGHAVYSISQDGFRFRNDDGSESTATWKLAENTNWEAATSTTQNFRLRLMVQEYGGATGTSSFLLQFSTNGGGAWTDLTTSTSPVRLLATANVTDGATTTDQIGGTGTFDGGQFRETATSSTVNHSASGHSEHEWSLQLTTAFTGGSILFRLYRTESNAPPSSITQTPQIFAPTLINSIEELNAIRNNTDGAGRIIGNYKLARDLDFNDDASYDNPANKSTYTTGAGWVSLGSTGNPWFGANFDGDGHTISNLMCNDTTTGVSNAGLFGVTDSSIIENLGLINPRINANATNTAFNQCGALVMGYDTEGGNTLRNCFVRGGVVVGGTGSGNNGTGGMVGIAHEYGTGQLDIIDCYVEGTEVYRNGTSPAANNGVGGLVGTFNILSSSGSSHLNITDSWAAARVVDGDSTATRGGLIGYEDTTTTYTTSYYNSTLTPYAGAGGTGQTTTWMQTYTNWSSDYSIANGYSNLTTQTWYIQSGDYPRLYYENYSPEVTVDMVSGSRTVNNYYVDGSDVAASDPNGHWASETNLTDGVLASYATNDGSSGDGSVSTGYIEATGTTAPSSGGHIFQVRARFHDSHAITDNETVHMNVYYSSELLGYVTRGPIGGAGYSDYVELSTPSGGWTWAKIQALRARLWFTRTVNNGYVGIDLVDIEVTSETTPTTSSTPALVMNGVDTEGNDIRYNVQIDTVDTFTSPDVDVVSGTHAGFSGSPDNTDPFTSGQDVTYTVQSALADGTYYWRARGIDPNGHNVYGDWSNPSSFQVVGVASYTVSHTTDSVKKKATTASHTTSSNKKKETSVSHTTSANLVDKAWTYEDAATLPTNDNLLANSYNDTDRSNVATNDNVFKDLTGSGNLIEQVWWYHDNNVDEITPSWSGKSTLAPSASAVYLQIYNHTTDTWTTLDFDNATAADTEFTLTGSQTDNLAQYYDTGNRVALRVYQEVV